MELMYEKARPKDAPVIFGFAKELIETYETDPDLDLAMALDWTRRKIEKRIGEYTRVLADGETARPYSAGVSPRAGPYTSTSSRKTPGLSTFTKGKGSARWRT